MPTPTLGELLGGARRSIAAARRELSFTAAPGQVRTVAIQLGAVVRQLRAYPDTVVWDPSRLPDPRRPTDRSRALVGGHLRAAQRHFTAAANLPDRGPAGAAGRYLENAEDHLGVARDLIRSHRGSGSPYARLLPTDALLTYLTEQVAAIAEEIGRLSISLAHHSLPLPAAALRHGAAALNAATRAGQQ